MDRGMKIIYYLMTGVLVFAICVMLELCLTGIFVGVPTHAYNTEFKEAFCETQGFDKYEEETCIKFNNGNAAITEIYCEDEPQFGFWLFDGMFKKITNCRTVIK